MKLPALIIAVCVIVIVLATWLRIEQGLRDDKELQRICTELRDTRYILKILVDFRLSDSSLDKEGRVIFLDASNRLKRNPCL